MCLSFITSSLSGFPIWQKFNMVGINTEPNLCLSRRHWRTSTCELQNITKIPIFQYFGACAQACSVRNFFDNAKKAFWRHFFWSCGLEMTKSWLEFHFLVRTVDFNTEAISWWMPCWKWFGDVVMTQQQHGQCLLIPVKLGHKAVLFSRKCRSGQRAGSSDITNFRSSLCSGDLKSIRWLQ